MATSGKGDVKRRACETTNMRAHQRGTVLRGAHRGRSFKHGKDVCNKLKELQSREILHINNFEDWSSAIVRHKGVRNAY